MAIHARAVGTAGSAHEMAALSRQCAGPCRRAPYAVAGVRKDGPVRRRVMQWWRRRSSKASTSGLFWNRPHHWSQSGLMVMRVAVRW